MTSKDVNEYLEGIQAAVDGGDNEMAHMIEDQLYQSVLWCVVNKEGDYIELAKLALKAQDIKYTRWCA